MDILWTIVIGFVVGAIAKLLTPGRDPGGFIITILLGIGGSFVATYIGQRLGWYRRGPAGRVHRSDSRSHPDPHRLPVDQEEIAAEELLEYGAGGTYPV